MKKQINITDETIKAKQNEVIIMCYDRLIEQLKTDKIDSSLLKCIETVRKDMATTVAPDPDSPNSCIADTIARAEAINKRINEMNRK